MHTDSRRFSSLSSQALMLVSLGVAVVVSFSAPAAGQTVEDGTGLTDPVIRVEEDWLLVLNEPSDEVEAPQFYTTMSPGGNLDWYYAVVIWNYREFPEYAPGGLQLQSWLGDIRLNRRSVGDRLLSTTAEAITWTQVLETDGIQLTFEITNGQSTTWGEFGRDMKIYEYAFLPNLNKYSTDQSVENACITYGANRVDALVLVSVRRYGPHGLISVDSTPRIIFEGVDPLIDGDDPEPLE
ncbi:MAG TPA: hypothetical protein PKG54_19775 [Phycisphaerae bacterium]|nr:hypothetical protein [Phycisphaerae bacterium]HOB76757.1 hypothetical protein [Phycisphaerae bacterium]HOJ53660.1 hypothetical protein [Phycisphaerae bacterium]HOL26385.1 hypothetical protein [Phycisphaerae bacterium]HPP21107.1 hypothetical protein [Phycisphaerae bacterium]